MLGVLMAHKMAVSHVRIRLITVILIQLKSQTPIQAGNVSKNAHPQLCHFLLKGINSQKGNLSIAEVS